MTNAARPNQGTVDATSEIASAFLRKHCDTEANFGIQQVIEIGPGKVLSGFMKKIDKEIQTARVEDSQTLADTLARFN